MGRRRRCCRNAQGERQEPPRDIRQQSGWSKVSEWTFAAALVSRIHGIGAEESPKHVHKYVEETAVTSENDCVR